MGLSLKRLLILSVLILVTWVCQITSRPLTDNSYVSKKHELWMARYGRVYNDNVEKEMRSKIFKKNAEFIDSFNSHGNRSFKLAINKFADRTEEELKAYVSGHMQDGYNVKPLESKSFRYESVSDVPSYMDWREKGAVTEVKNQGQCGSCWAFSTIAAVEGIIQLTTGSLISLSEQELIDCNRNGSNGCKGGSKESSFEYIARNSGINSETTYPYQEEDSTCNTINETVLAATIAGYETVPLNQELSLLKAVSQQPVSVSIDANGDLFKYYSSGVFTGDCGTNLTHDVTVVGYGTYDGIKYWLVKNSWGTDWGMNGYMMMERDVNAAEGLCGIAMQASFPIA